MKLDKAGIRLLVSYQRDSRGLFDEVPHTDLSNIKSWSKTQIQEYASVLHSGWMRSKRCLDGRVAFRDLYVPPDMQDHEHELPIIAARKRCEEYEDRCVKVRPPITLRIRVS
jgi:hypothetical protein